MLKNILSVLFAGSILMSASVASAGQVMTHAEIQGTFKASHADFIYCIETYKADNLKAESLDDIVEYYIEKNTYGMRSHDEFKDGILEVNAWLCSRKDKHGQIMVEPGEEIVVYYWKKCK